VTSLRSGIAFTIAACEVFSIERLPTWSLKTRYGAPTSHSKPNSPIGLNKVRLSFSPVMWTLGQWLGDRIFHSSSQAIADTVLNWRLRDHEVLRDNVLLSLQHLLSVQNRGTVSIPVL
jgi:hypothetical protein